MSYAILKNSVWHWYTPLLLSKGVVVNHSWASDRWKQNRLYMYVMYCIQKRQNDSKRYQWTFLREKQRKGRGFYFVHRLFFVSFILFVFIIGFISGYFGCPRVEDKSCCGAKNVDDDTSGRLLEQQALELLSGQKIRDYLRWVSFCINTVHL